MNHVGEKGGSISARLTRGVVGSNIQTADKAGAVEQGLYFHIVALEKCRLLVRF